MPVEEIMRVDPEVHDALMNALKAIQRAKSLTTVGPRCGLYDRLQIITDELRRILE
jgi:hypothetical protein